MGEELRARNVEDVRDTEATSGFNIPFLVCRVLILSRNFVDVF